MKKNARNRTRRNTFFLRKRSGTVRPCGDPGFIRNCETETGRILNPQKPGPKIENNKVY
jgi:hypothetical protein